MKLAIACLAAIAAPASAQITFSTFARSDIAYPGLPPGCTISFFPDSPLIAQDGSAACIVILDTPDGLDYALLTDGPTMLHREDGPAPGTPGGTLFFFHHPPVALGASTVACPSAVNVPGWDNGEMLYISSPGGTTPVTSWLQVPPGYPPDSFFSHFLDPAFNATSLAFCGTITKYNGLILGNAIYTGTPGNISLLVKDSDEPPGFPGKKYWQFADDAPILNAAGQVAFVAHTSPGGITALFRATANAIDVIAQENQPAPGLPEEVLTAPSNAVMGSDGHIMFQSFLKNAPGFPSSFRDGLWIGNGAAPVAIALGGDPAPGTDCEFESFGANQVPRFVGAEARHLVFRARLSHELGVPPDIDTGLWAGTASGLHLVARENDQAVGCEAGVVYQSFLDFAINSRGQVLFHVSLRGPGTSDVNSRMLVYADPWGRLTKIARGSDTITLEPGVEKLFYTFATFDSSAPSNGHATCLSDAGDAIFAATFYTPPKFGDGYAVLIAHLPDPCYADCDASGELDIDDFLCFQTAFGIGDPFADCDGSGEVDIDDFICFQTAFGTGCP